jgi:hypothetical protein
MQCSLLMLVGSVVVVLLLELKQQVINRFHFAPNVITNIDRKVAQELDAAGL